MKKLLISALLAGAASLATPAFANPNDPGPLPGCSPSGGSPQKCEGDVNNGGNANVEVTNTNTAIAGANATSVSGATATGGAGGDGGSATATGGDATATGGNANAAGGNSSSSSTSNSGGNSLSNVTNYKRAHRVAPQAYAPTIIGGECQKTTSGGISTPFGGFSLGGSRSNSFCEVMKMVGFASETLGRADLACQLLYYSDKRWAEAMRQSGVGCPAYAPRP